MPNKPLKKKSEKRCIRWSMMKYYTIAKRRRKGCPGRGNTVIGSEH